MLNSKTDYTNHTLHKDMYNKLLSQAHKIQKSIEHEYSKKPDAIVSLHDKFLNNDVLEIISIISAFFIKSNIGADGEDLLITKYASNFVDCVFTDEKNISSLPGNFERAFYLIDKVLAKDNFMAVERPVLEFTTYYITKSIIDKLYKGEVSDHQDDVLIKNAVKNEITHFYYLNSTSNLDYKIVILPILMKKDIIVDDVMLQDFSVESQANHKVIGEALHNSLIDRIKIDKDITNSTTDATEDLNNPFDYAEFTESILSQTSTVPPRKEPELVEEQVIYMDEYYRLRENIETYALNERLNIPYKGICMFIGIFIAMMLGLFFAQTIGAIFACGLGAGIGYLSAIRLRNLTIDQWLDNSLYYLNRDADSLYKLSADIVPEITSPSNVEKTDVNNQETFSQNMDKNSVLSYDNNQLCLSIDNKGWYIYTTNEYIPKLIEIFKESSLQALMAKYSNDSNPLEYLNDGRNIRINIDDPHVTDIMLLLDHALALKKDNV